MVLIDISHKYFFVEQLMSNLRDVGLQKDSRQFQRSMHTLGQILGLELSCHLNYVNGNVVTPFGVAQCKQLDGWPTIIPILRAGRALQEGLSSILVNSPIVDCVCPKYINGQRHAKIDLDKINLCCPCVICEPVITGGKSVISAVEALRGHCSYIYVLSCITSDYSLPLLEKTLPEEAIIFTCAIDEFNPNEVGTRPGLGDVGDLLYGPQTYKLSINSSYESINESARFIPANVNVKMIFRHSFRDSFVGEKDYQTMPLNEYGVLKARDFGRSIEYPIGEMYSSELMRCMQTLEYMTGNSSAIVVTDYLSSVFTYDNAEADRQIRVAGSLREVIIELKRGIKLPGFYPICDIVKKIIDFVFETGNKEHTLDLYCTHDFHIGMMLAMMFDEIETIDDLDKNWPDMLEGVLLYGTRESFYCLWRGTKKHFDNYLI